MDSPSLEISAPPAYLNATEDSAQLPAYRPLAEASSTTAESVSRATLREYSFEVKGTRKTAAAELILIAPAHLGKNVPTYMTSAPVGGRVLLYLKGPETIQAVNLHIRGAIYSINTSWGDREEGVTFLDIHEKVWVPETKYAAKLDGQQEWSFSITLPTEVSLPIGRGKEIRTFNLPETSRDQTLYHSITYEATLHIRRSRFKSDHHVSTPVGIIPAIRPAPPSTLRQLAYQEQTPVSGPDLDPEGWHILDPVAVQGKVFGVRAMSLKCTLSLAKPLSYTRGTVIPLNLTLESEDEQATDLLSSPESIIVRLRRIVHHHSRGATNIDDPSRKDYEDDYRLSSFLTPTKSDFTSASSLVKTFRRQLYGEVHLDKGLKPTTSILNIKIEYFVVLFPFKAAGYEPNSKDPLAIIPVEIATLHAPGPQSRRYAPLKEDDSTVLNDRFRVSSSFMN